MWAYEVYEMYRRLFFMGVLPVGYEYTLLFPVIDLSFNPTLALPAQQLLGEGSTRAFIGIFVSIWTAHLARESWPFIRSTISVLLVVAMLQILFVYFCAALLLTDSFEGFGWSDFELGSILFAVNLLTFFLVIYWGYQMYLEEKRRKNCLLYTSPSPRD